VVRFHAAQAQTTHPEPGQGRTLRPPKPSKAIAAVLSEFTDIPKEAAAEIKNLEGARSRIAELERELRHRPKEQVTREHTVEVPSKRDLDVKHNEPYTITPSRHRVAPAANGDDAGDDDEGADAAKSGMRRVLISLAENGGVTKRKLAVLARLKPSGSTMRGILATGRREGWIDDGDDGLLKITDAGVAELGTYKPLPRPGPELVAYWKRRLGGGASGVLFGLFAAEYPRAFARDELAERANLQPGGSTMRGAMAKLRALGLVEKNQLRASAELFG
jgi:hypothetical protein